MNNTEELLEDSDSSDEDYTPGKKPDEVLSEVDSDGDPEDSLSENEDISGKTRKRTKNTKKSRKKLKKTETDSSVPDDSLDNKPKEITVEEKKKIEDDLWADFMKDTGFQSKKNSQENVSNKVKQNNDKADTTKKPVEKVKITQVFEFAGEEVTVDKEVPVNSAEARLLSKSTPESSNSKVRSKGGLSGISSVLSQLGKKPKISTLEKSKLDWDRFKKEENLEEELQTHNKGKDGYLERQDFLQRADLRRFEIEKELRTVERNKRMNSL